jgi:hypothetical protein
VTGSDKATQAARYNPDHSEPIVSGVAPAIAINSALAFLTIAPTAIALARLGPRRETTAA